MPHAGAPRLDRRFQQGPIDCSVGAEGAASALEGAMSAVDARFREVLDELMRDLPLLRADLSSAAAAAAAAAADFGSSPSGPIARRMVDACRPHAAGGRFITAMAAVAGSVAEELVACFDRPGISRAWVNNGGDIALHLAPGTRVDVGTVADLPRAYAGRAPEGRFTVDASSPVRGIATSGWRGRSFSLGIADAVTVLARTASAADAAATVVANAVDVDAPGIARRPASDLRDDSDLGDRLVTVGVPTLVSRDVDAALDAGARQADAEIAAGRIVAAILQLQGRVRVCGTHRGLAPIAPPRAMLIDATATPPAVDVRKLVVSTEDVWHDGGPRLEAPLRRGWCAAVVRNPYAGGYVADIQPLMEALKPLGHAMAERLVAALGGAGAIQSYGKGALVGLAGELEHGALWHVPGGYGMRDLLEGSHAIVPSTTKVGPAGTSIDIPLHHRVAAYVRSHFDGVTVQLADAPRPNELLFAIAMATGPRPHARVGGLTAADIAKFDGQR